MNNGDNIVVKFTNDAKTKAYIKYNVDITINHKIYFKTIQNKSFLSKKETKIHRILNYSYDEFRLRNIEKIKKILSQKYGIKMKHINCYSGYKYYKNLGIEIEFISLINIDGDGVLQKIRKSKIKKILEWVY